MTTPQSDPLPGGVDAEPSALDDPRVIQATQEYAAALRAGQRPDRQAFLARHPDIAPALAECLDGLEFICKAAPQVAPSAPFPTPADEYQPELHGDFRILRKIGRGGMGVVYEAEQVSLGRRVALKVLPFSAALDGRQLQRFKQEAQAAALLHHTNIVPVFAVGCERGVHYYAMQFIEGRNLATVIEELRHPAASAPACPLDLTVPYGPPGLEPCVTRAGLSTERSVKSTNHVRMAAGLAVQVAEALAHAHRHGVVHRDIKLANILIDTHGNPWVTDFGLARLQGDGNLTVSGDLIGTIRYMSPEQAAGDRAVIDHRTDVYSLGATLYELLTLQPAFDGTDRRSILRQILHDEPLPARCLNEAIPTDLEIIVQKAMAKSVEERYATAQEFADDLRRFLQDRPILARRPSLGQRFLKWARRHLAVVTAAALATFVILVALAVSTVLIWRAKNSAQAAYDQEAAQRALSDRNRLRAERNLALALQALDEVYLRIAERRFPGDPVLERTDREVLQKAITFYQQFSAENEDSPQARRETVRAHRRVGEIYQWLGRPKRAEAALREAVALGERRVGEVSAGPDDTHILADSLSSLGVLLQEINRLAEAEQTHRRALELRRQLAAEAPAEPDRQLDLAADKLNLGFVLNRANRLHEAAACYSEALDLLKEVQERFPAFAKGRRNRIHLAQAYQGWGAILSQLDRRPEAKTALREAERRWRALAAELGHTPGPRVNLARSLQTLGAVLDGLGEGEAAELAFREALELRKRLAAEFPGVPGYRDGVAGSYHDLAHLLERQGRLAEAEEAALQSLGIREKLAAEFPPVPQYQEGLARSYHNLGSIRRVAGRKDDARRALAEATTAWDQLAAQFASAPAQRYLAALGLLELGLLLRADGQLPEAERACRKAVTLLETLAADLPHMALYVGALSNAHQHLGWVLRDAGRLAEAEVCYRNGVAARLAQNEEARKTPHERFRLANAYHNLGDVFLRRQNYAEAEQACQKSIDLRQHLPESFQSLPENRHMLALDRLTLGSAATAAGRSSEAGRHLAAALELARSLTADFPQEATYRDTLSKVLTQISRSEPTPPLVEPRACEPPELKRRWIIL